MKDNFLQGFGNKIKERREELGLTQGDLAKIIGYTSHSSIAKIELGLVDIPQSKIIAFADALQVTPAYLMGWTDDPQGHTNEEHLTIPEQFKDVMVAFQNGAENLTQQDVDAVVQFIEFLKNKDK